jgi:hypothetical protein
MIIFHTGMIHIIASNELDAAFAQGFVSAQVQFRTPQDFNRNGKFVFLCFLTSLCSHQGTFVANGIQSTFGSGNTLRGVG